MHTCVYVPLVCVCACAQVGVKLLNHSPFLASARGMHKQVDEAGLVSAKWVDGACVHACMS